MKIEKNLTNPKNYCEERKCKIYYIVIQEIGNKFSPHYHIVDGKAIQIVPDRNMSNSVNGGRVNKYGTLHGVCTKYNSISIGIGNNPSSDDLKVCIDLIMTLKQRYNIKMENIIRQRDITGEANPERWCDKDKWKTEIVDKLIEFTELT